jgi:hypothetical protein
MKLEMGGQLIENSAATTFLSEFIAIHANPKRFSHCNARRYIHFAKTMDWRGKNERKKRLPPLEVKSSVPIQGGTIPFELTMTEPDFRSATLEVNLECACCQLVNAQLDTFAPPCETPVTP